MNIRVPSYKTLYHHGLLIVLIFMGIAPGIWQEIIIPTLPNLKEKLNVSYEVMGRMMSMRSMGNIAALLIAGFVYDSFPAIISYVMSGTCLLGGLCTLTLPWCNQFWLVVILFFIQSGAQNLLTTGAQLIILKTFKQKAVGKMQIYHLGYGIGGLLSGFISQPFLTKKLSHNTKITKYCKTLSNYSYIQNITEFIAENNNKTFKMQATISFEYIYVIAGIAAVLISMAFFAFSFIPNPKNDKVEIIRKESWVRKIHPKYIANGKICFGTTMEILLFLYYFFYIFGLLNFLPYIVVYAIDPCKKYSMNQKTAAYLHSAVNTCFLVGRLFGSLLSELNATIMILSFNFFNIIFILILIAFSNDYSLALWIGACGMRFCNSVVYPTGTSYVNRYITVSSTLISIAFLGGTFGDMLGQYSGGFFIDNYPSYYVLYMSLGSMCMLFISTLLIVLLGWKFGPREFLQGTNKVIGENLEILKKQAI